MILAYAVRGYYYVDIASFLSAVAVQLPVKVEEQLPVKVEAEQHLPQVEVEQHLPQVEVEQHLPQVEVKTARLLSRKGNLKQS